MAFIGYEKAFDSADTAAVREAFKNQGIQETCIRLLDGIYKECTVGIILDKKSEKFLFRKGVRQGEAIAPKLFTA